RSLRWGGSLDERGAWALLYRNIDDPAPRGPLLEPSAHVGRERFGLRLIQSFGDGAARRYERHAAPQRFEQRERRLRELLETDDRSLPEEDDARPRRLCRDRGRRLVHLHRVPDAMNRVVELERSDQRVKHDPRALEGVGRQSAELRGIE